MLDEYGFETYEENEFPLAYLITIRTFGTWLHGDERHSVDRHGRNIYGTPDIPPNQELRERMKSELKQRAIVLNQSQRKAVESAFKAFATKKLREENLCDRELRVWSRGRSRRYLWKPRHVAKAIDYVLYGQGDVPFDPEDDD